jgi:hypothetical protein
MGEEPPTNRQNAQNPRCQLMLSACAVDAVSVGERALSPLDRLYHHAVSTACESLVPCARVDTNFTTWVACCALFAASSAAAGTSHEAHFPAEPNSSEANARLSRANEQQRRQSRTQPSPRKGPQAPGTDDQLQVSARSPFGARCDRTSYPRRDGFSAFSAR